MHRRTAVIVGLIAIGVGVRSAQAGALAPAKASQMVTLGSSSTSPLAPCMGSGAPYRFDKVLKPDGTQPDFVIPAGYVFVITGMDWETVGAAPGSAITAALAPGPGASLWEDTVFTDGTGHGGDTAPVPGIVVKPGTALCYVFPGTPFRANLHGFLAKDK